MGERRRGWESKGDQRRMYSSIKLIKKRILGELATIGIEVEESS